MVTNDIYTKEDAEFLTRSGALAPERILGVETGGCPHTAIREDASINLAAIDQLVEAFPKLELVFIESGGDNLAATFSPELADLTIYVIDVAAGDKIPRKGGPGITRSDLLVINKIDLAPSGRRRPRRDGARRPTDARRAPVRVHQHPRGPGRAGGGGVHHADGRAGSTCRLTTSLRLRYERCCCCMIDILSQFWISTVVARKLAQGERPLDWVGSSKKDFWPFPSR